MGGWKRGGQRKPRHFSPCTSGHLPATASSPWFDSVLFAEDPTSSTGKQPKGSPISHASSSLPADCANSHVDPGLFLELSFPVFKLLLPQTPQPPQGLTLPPSRQLTASCYLNLGNNSKCSKPSPSPSEGKQ